MLRKKENLTIITPIPGFIPRQLAIDILHSHSEVITLNPLVLEHRPIKAPRDAAADEFYSTWYEITQRIQFLPGVGKIGTGKINFNGCFHNLPWGLQTHVYAPLNVDLRNKYRICGNQPGYEPPEKLEIGLAELGAPADGLYLREDIEIKCNVATAGFVKSQLKAAGKEMVSRIIKKAELLDAGVLQAMIEDGQLKTFNPADRTTTLTPMQPQPSPTQSSIQPSPLSPRLPYQVPRVNSVHGGYPPASQLPYPAGHPTPPPIGYAQAHPGQTLPAELPLTQSAAPASFPMELPGDCCFFSQASPQPQPSPGQLSVTERQSRPTSHSSNAGPGPYHSSQGLDPKGFSYKEIAEEHRDQAPRRLDPAVQKTAAYAYNPQDYAKVSPPLQPPRYNYAQ